MRLNERFFLRKRSGWVLLKDVNNDNQQKTTTMNTKQMIKLLSGRMIVYVGQQDGFPLLVLDNGTKVLISSDDEMNAAGSIIEL